MSRYDGQWAVLSAEEARALDGERRVLDELNAALASLNAHGCAECMQAIELAAWGVVDAAVEVRHARLCRMRPDLADLFALANYPAFMSAPDFLERSGAPKQATEPEGLGREGHRVG